MSHWHGIHNTMEKVYKGKKTFYAPTRKEWRLWLKENHSTEKFVWLIIYRKESEAPSIYYEEAVEEALCFGWIDSKGNKRDDKSFYLSFARRNPKSNWSGINKERIERLIKNGRMEPEGLKMVEQAKESGTWNALDDVENCVVPDDLQKSLDANRKAFENFEAFPPSSKKIILLWIMSAKKSETRLKRILETVELAEKNIRANHWGK